MVVSQRLPLSLLFVLGLAGPLLAADVTYESSIRPILKAHCFQCHGERGTQEGDLDLRLRRLIVKGGESGPAIVPGDPQSSLLFRRVSLGEMPPGEARLSADELAKISDWITARAPTAREEPAKIADQDYFTQEEKNWWSFQPVSKALPPVIPLAATPIDAFVLSKLSQLESHAPQTAKGKLFAPRGKPLHPNSPPLSGHARPASQLGRGATFRRRSESRCLASGGRSSLGVTAIWRTLGSALA